MGSSAGEATRATANATKIEIYTFQSTGKDPFGNIWYLSTHIRDVVWRGTAPLHRIGTNRVLVPTPHLDCNRPDSQCILLQSRYQGQPGVS